MTSNRSLAPIRVPPREVFETAEGLRCVVAPRGQIPLVAVRLMMAGGSAMDPRGLEGLCDFTLGLLRRGTKKRSAEQIDEAIERVGGTFHTGSYEDYSALTMTAPAADLEALLLVLGDLVRNPRFAPKEVSAARSRSLAELENDLDDPGSLCDRALLPALWGNHPYGHDGGGTLKSLRRFTPAVVSRFHREKVGPRTLGLYVVGPVDARRVEKAARKALGGWKSPAEMPEPLEPVTAVAHPGEIWLIDKPEQTQSQVRIAGMTYRRGDSDAHPMRLLNTVLGGGFTSRLVNEIRVNRGLSYGVGCGLDPLLAGGSHTFASFTKTETTREILDVALQIIEEVRGSGVRESELAQAKSYLCGTYPMRTETNEAMASAMAEVDFYRLAPDWIERYRERVQAITLDEVHAAGKRHLMIGPPVMVVVGRAKELKRQLAGLGKVRVMDASKVA